MAGSDGTVVGPLKEADLRRDVMWRDLVRYRRIDTIIEMLLPAPWLVGAIWFSARGDYLLALPCTFFLFLTLLRVAHNGYHNALGLPRVATDVLLVLLSPLMMLPLHAVKVTHLEHHRHCLGAQDIEGEAGRKSFWAVLAYRAAFPDRCDACGMARRPRIRWRIVLEFALIVGVCLAALGAAWPALVYHAVAMTVGECFTAFFAVWVVHHGTVDHVYPARTTRMAEEPD